MNPALVSGYIFSPMLLVLFLLKFPMIVAVLHFFSNDWIHLIQSVRYFVRSIFRSFFIIDDREACLLGAFFCLQLG